MESKSQNESTQSIFNKNIELDSDVNEDRGREQQLDASFEDWYRNIGHWEQQKLEMTQVPKSNVFDVAANMEEK
ncbi:hypothetical protein [Paenibacillus sp. JDR-2]|uniref:hypothetical protein n=1 Tax=Paenibacillus sp. (strain JDR-2) TaxID=324057 RepID=UPI0001664475|nr:hypothetical protein [Paenibacillus sp. JDR-2]ACT01501.1 hypothetical protein Pjdr2_2852 [Paenibacillus sp. JDR-2]